MHFLRIFLRSVGSVYRAALETFQEENSGIELWRDWQEEKKAADKFLLVPWSRRLFSHVSVERSIMAHLWRERALSPPRLSRLLLGSPNLLC